MLVLLVALAAVGLPAAVLTATCAGRSCESAGGGEIRVPFCPLPEAVKAGVVNGFRAGRRPLRRSWGECQGYAVPCLTALTYSRLCCSQSRIDSGVSW